MSQALLIVDHGSRREEANQMLEEVARTVRRLCPDVIVHIAHMELAEPSIRQGIETCIQDGATNIAVHPYMLLPGRHATQDIPQMVQEIATGFPETRFRVTDPLGLHDKIGEVILERAGLV